VKLFEKVLKLNTVQFVVSTSYLHSFVDWRFQFISDQPHVSENAYDLSARTQNCTRVARPSKTRLDDREA